MPLKSYEIEGFIQITELAKSSQFKLAGCDIDLMAIPPYTTMRPHFHRHFDEAFYVQSGQGVCQLGGKTFPVQAGDFFLAMNGQLHAVSTNESPIVVLTICLPFFDETDIIYES